MLFRSSKQYRVVQDVYTNKYGEKEYHGYHIQYLWFKIFGREIWFNVTHEESSMGGPYSVTTKFLTAGAAEKHIQEVLCKQIQVEKWTKEVISTYQCSK